MLKPFTDRLSNIVAPQGHLVMTITVPGRKFAQGTARRMSRGSKPRTRLTLEAVTVEGSTSKGKESLSPLLYPYTLVVARDAASCIRIPHKPVLILLVKERWEGGKIMFPSTILRRGCTMKTLTPWSRSSRDWISSVKHTLLKNPTNEENLIPNETVLSYGFRSWIFENASVIWKKYWQKLWLV